MVIEEFDHSEVPVSKKRFRIIRDGDEHHLKFLKEIISKFGDENFKEGFDSNLSALLDFHFKTATEIAKYEKSVERNMIKSVIPLAGLVLGVAIYASTNQLNSNQKELVILAALPLIAYIVVYLAKASHVRIYNSPRYIKLYELKQNIYANLNQKDLTNQFQIDDREFYEDDNLEDIQINQKLNLK